MSFDSEAKGIIPNISKHYQALPIFYQFEVMPEEKRLFVKETSDFLANNKTEVSLLS